MYIYIYYKTGIRKRIWVKEKKIKKSERKNKEKIFVA